MRYDDVEVVEIKSTLN